MDFRTLVAPLLAAGVLLLAAIPYVRRARHPLVRPVAAYVMFVVAFVGVSGTLFGILLWLLAATGRVSWLDTAAGAAAFLVVVFAPAFAVARYVIRRPPRPPPEI